MAKLKSGTRIYGDTTVDNKLQITSGPVLVGTATSTGTVSQQLQVTGGAYVSGSVGVGITNPSQTLHVQGNVRISGGIYDSNNNVGTAGSVLSSTGSGLSWIAAATGGGGGSGTFDTGITTSVYISAISGLGTNTTTNNDIFVGPGIAGTSPGIGLSMPSTASRKYVIESIQITNTYSNELYLTARQDFNLSSNSWRAVPMVQRLIVPYQGSVELINQPMIASPQDHFRFQALAGSGTTATGIDGGLDVFMVYSTKTDTNFVGVGSTVASTTGAEVYRSTTYPSVVQSIRLCNYNLNIDVDASVSIYRGGTAGSIPTTGVRLGYLAYNMTIPKNSVVEILDKPKYIVLNDTIVATASTINSLSVCVAGKYIV